MARFSSSVFVHITNIYWRQSGQCCHAFQVGFPCLPEDPKGTGSSTYCFISEADSGRLAVVLRLQRTLRAERRYFTFYDHMRYRYLWYFFFKACLCSRNCLAETFESELCKYKATTYFFFYPNTCASSIIHASRSKLSLFKVNGCQLSVAM